MAQISDIEIARGVKLKNIVEVSKSLGLNEDDIELYGKNKAKIDIREVKKNKNSKLVLVTAINPTPKGEGKTTVTIGLTDGLKLSGKKVSAVLREPSLGPVFGLKGGATGGGYSQIAPMEDINLHFTGDFHAISSATNLLAAMLDNHIFQGNSLNIDNRKIVLNRVVDMNDRQLRNIVCGLGGKMNGITREDHFDITVASETMAILCLSTDIEDLKNRLSRMIVAYTYDDEPVTANDLGAVGAMAALLKDAIKPNIVQTLIGTPAIVHGGPFANIAHGCNSVIATKTALSLADYVVTEAGFGADLGAEKFLDIKCRAAGLSPSAVVIVATIRALKYHSGDETLGETEKLRLGMSNLKRHLNNIKNVYHLPVVVAINVFENDTDEEMRIIADECAKSGVKAIQANVWAEGGKGALELSKEVINICENDTDEEFSYCYELEDSIEEKLKKIATKIYGARGIILSEQARKTLKKIEKLGLYNLPVCVAKTQYSFSDNAKLLGAPEDFDITVRDLKISAGAGFIVALTGSILTMPGLPKKPAANDIDVDNNGIITGIF